MGLRSGLIIGFILTLTIAATFLVMGYYQITLERISLGALIIALGMLVDNAIVVVDGMKVRMEQGMDGLAAAKAVVAQNTFPLLGATAVAVLAFAAIGTSKDVTGEFLMSLFLVMAASLGLSWILAITLTPLFCVQFLPRKKAGPKGDPYGGRTYRLYRSFLSLCLKHRAMSMAALVAILAGSLYGFSFVEVAFFPPACYLWVHITQGLTHNAIKIG